jgi:hypothetical protein
MKIAHPKYQRGAALLLFLLVALIMAGGMGLKALNQATTHSPFAGENQVLQQAKEAVIGYALAYADINPNNLPGYLPCPDMNGDGDAEPVCGVAGQSAIGFLPWRTLGLPPLRDSSGSCLWYGVSGAYKASPQGALSTEANGQLLLFDTNLNSLNGINNSEASLAVVFAPGKALVGQNRSVTPAAATECGSNNAADAIRQAQNYLETLAGINNANGFFVGMLSGVPIMAIPSVGFSAFITGEVQDTFNDALTSIRPNDFQPVYNRMQQWVGERVRQCLGVYQAGNAGKLPWPAVLNPLAIPAYSDNNTANRFGRVPANLANSAAAGLAALWPVDPQQPASQCFSWGWWANFRETVFYGIDLSISPTGVAAPPILSVDATPNAGAVIVAGRVNGIQARVTSNNKGSIANYLETGNIIDAGAGLIPPGDEAFISADNAAAAFNDYVCTLSACP